MRSQPSLTRREWFEFYLVRSPHLEVEQTTGSQLIGEVEKLIFAYFFVYSPYFRVNSIEISYRKLSINNLRENNAKEDKYFARECDVLSKQGRQYCGFRPPFLLLRDRLFFAIIP